MDWHKRRDGRRRGGGWDSEPTEKEVFGEKKTRSTAGINFDDYDKIPVQVSGRDADTVVPMERFSAAKLQDGLRENLKRCGYERPTPVQKYSVPCVSMKR